MENFFLELAQAAGQVAAVVFKALSPLITGLVLAYLFNRPVEWVRSKISGADRVSQRPWRCAGHNLYGSFHHHLAFYIRIRNTHPGLPSLRGH